MSQATSQPTAVPVLDQVPLKSNDNQPPIVDDEKKEPLGDAEDTNSPPSDSSSEVRLPWSIFQTRVDRTGGA